MARLIWMLRSVMQLPSPKLRSTQEPAVEFTAFVFIVAAVQELGI
jgi:hypothetical protein